MNLVTVDIIFKAFFLNLTIVDQTTKDQMKNFFIQQIFPWLISGAFLLCSGLYCVTTVQDREEKLRYLLNFAGMRPSAYYLGLLLGDFWIFIVPSVLLIFLARALGQE
jgi:hypothetical protein